MRVPSSAISIRGILKKDSLSSSIVSSTALKHFLSLRTEEPVHPPHRLLALGGVTVCNVRKHDLCLFFRHSLNS
jgi:hypothetical protein